MARENPGSMYSTSWNALIALQEEPRRHEEVESDRSGNKTLQRIPKERRLDLNAKRVSSTTASDAGVNSDHANTTFSQKHLVI